MSFPRHEEIFRSDVGSSHAGSRSCGLPPALIGLDEFPVGYSLAGCSPAAPASALPTGGQCAVNSSCRSSNFQRTANSVLTGCLTPGGKRTARTLLLGLRSYGHMCQSRWLSSASVLHLVRGVFAGCYQPLLPAGSSRRYAENLSSDAWAPTPAVPLSALAWFFLSVFGLPQR
jgi:hypothetical protein